MPETASNELSLGVGKLAAALAAARAEFKSVEKGRVAKIESAKAGYSYKYADLSDVLAAVMPALSKHELALVQTTALAEGGMLLLTRLIHSSGESVMGEYPLPLGAKAQEMGSAITYARRYSVCALLGIAAEEDDDGAAANEMNVAEHNVRTAGPPARTSETLPPCPKCKSTNVIRSKFPGPDFYCMGCRNKYGVADVVKLEPGVDEAAELFR